MVRYPFLLTIFFFILISFPMVATAEFYEYKDEHGVLHFTDNLADVPEGLRPSTIEHPSIQSSEEKPNPADADHSINELLDTIRKTAEKVSPEDIQSHKRKLDTIKAELDEERKLLEQQRENLQALKKKALSKTEIHDYNEKVKILEKKISAFNLKAQAYDKQIDALNAIIREAEE